MILYVISQVATNELKRAKETKIDWKRQKRASLSNFEFQDESKWVSELLKWCISSVRKEFVSF